MTDTRDPRGIVTFIVRYLMLQVGLLFLLVLSLSSSLVLLTFICLMGFFTFFQVLIAITRKFLEKAGSWKPVAIAGAVFSDVAVVWFLGALLGGFLGGPSWELVTAWLPYHFVAAFFAWGLREIFFWLTPRDAATPSTPVSPAEPAASENPDESNDADAPTSAPATADTDTDTDTDTDKQ